MTKERQKSESLTQRTLQVRRSYVDPDVRSKESTASEERFQEGKRKGGFAEVMQAHELPSEMRSDEA